MKEPLSSSPSPRYYSCYLEMNDILLKEKKKSDYEEVFFMSRLQTEEAIRDLHVCKSKAK